MKKKRYFFTATFMAAVILLGFPTCTFAETATTEAEEDAGNSSKVIFDSSEKALQLDDAVILEDDTAVLTFTYTNKKSEERMPIVEYIMFPYQDGVSLEATTVSDDNYNNLVAAAATSVKDGESVTFAYAFKLNNTSDVRLEVSDSIFGGNIRNIEIPLIETETGIGVDPDFMTSADDSSSEANDTESEESSDEKGTRANPYYFNDEVVVYDYPYSAHGDALKYTFTFSEIWKNERVAEEYPNWDIENRIIIRTKIDVASEDTDAKTDMDLQFKIVTDTLNELSTNVETYEPGDLNNFLGDVYPGGSYDCIIMGSDDGSGLKDTQYLTIEYTTQGGEQSEIWVSLESSDDTEGTQAAESTEQVSETESGAETVSAAENSEAAEKGTRSNPYQFSDEVVVYDYPYSADGEALKYTFTFSEIWKNERVAEEYPNYVLENRIAVRTKLDVSADSLEDKMDMDLQFKILTDTLNELYTNFITYDPGQLNYLYDVYPGGSYDCIIMTQDDGSGLKTISYLTITYNTQDGDQKQIWISLE